LSSNAINYLLIIYTIDLYDDVCDVWSRKIIYRVILLQFLTCHHACVVQVVGDRNVYNNELIYAEHDPVYTFIIKHYKWTVGVECEVQRDGRTYGERRYR